jgi:hypothetical protein
MIITEVEHGLSLAANAPGFVRSPGLHMSQIYGSLYAMIDPERYDKREPDGSTKGLDLVIMEEGMAFEEWLEPRLAARLLGARPGEFFTQHDAMCPLEGTRVRDGGLLCACGAGIAYSPDWLFDEPDGSTVLGEFKRTKYTLRGAPYNEKFDKWITQMKAYCYHLNVLRARLYVLFVMGDYSYKPPLGDEQIKAWEITFTSAELEREWARLLRHAHRKGLLPV